MDIPSKSLFSQEVKRYKFLSDDRSTGHTWLPIDAQQNITTFCYGKVTLGVTIVLLTNPFCAVETNLPF